MYFNSWVLREKCNKVWNPAAHNELLRENTSGGTVGYLFVRKSVLQFVVPPD